MLTFIQIYFECLYVILQNEELIASYREETEKRRQEIDELQTR